MRLYKGERLTVDKELAGLETEGPDDGRKVQVYEKDKVIQNIRIVFQNYEHLKTRNKELEKKTKGRLCEIGKCWDVKEMKILRVADEDFGILVCLIMIMIYIDR